MRTGESECSLRLASSFISRSSESELDVEGLDWSYGLRLRIGAAGRRVEGSTSKVKGKVCGWKGVWEQGRTGESDLRLASSFISRSYESDCELAGEFGSCSALRLGVWVCECVSV